MNLIKQFLILLFFVWLGQILNSFFHLPATVSGLLLMVIALLVGLIKAEWIGDASAWLLKISPVLFVPYLVSLLQSLDTIKPVLLYFLLICFGSTVITITVTAWVMNLLERRFK